MHVKITRGFSRRSFSPFFRFVFIILFDNLLSNRYTKVSPMESNSRAWKLEWPWPTYRILVE